MSLPSWTSNIDPLLCAAAGANLLSALLGAIVSLQEDWAKKHKVIVLTSFAVLGVVGVWATIAQSAKSASETTTTNLRLSGSLDDLGKSTQEIRRVTDLNTNLQEQLLESTRAVVSLSRQNINTVTGGQSFCYVAADPRVDYIVFIHFIHQGKYPLYGVQARIADLEKFKTLVKEKAPLSGADVAVTIGDMTPGGTRLIPAKIFPAELDHSDFNIFFNARNGFWTQELRMRRINGKWLHATRVTVNGPPQKKVLEQVDSLYPRNKQGLVDWD